MTGTKKKRYRHFDVPLEFASAEKLVTSGLSAHAFYPFLAYDKTARRYKGREGVSTKVRRIKYASHRDGYIYAYYAKELSALYEHRMCELGLDFNVIAYRKRKGSNVALAKQAFDEIKRRGNCVALAFDISGFFDNIDHEKLKIEWQSLLESNSLPEDHYSVFKSLTRWAEVEKKDCLERLEAANIGFDRDARHRPLCSAEHFRQFIKGKGGQPSLVRQNKDEQGNWNNYGIPQGTALSALLSNVFMLPFDCAMNGLAREVGGYYRRYSDDILWICNEEHVEQISEQLSLRLSERGCRLFIKAEKTERVRFEVCPNGRIKADGVFQYLGLTYDGRKTRLRSTTLAKYWRRMIYAVRAAKRAARTAQRSVFKKHLNYSLTHLGSGNFVSGYAYRADTCFDDSGIKRQLSRHQKRLRDELL